MAVLSPLAKRDAPRIAGSEAGFIALVVALSLLILSSSLAIYFLVRRSNTGPRYAAPSPASDPSPWHAPLTRLFTRAASSDSARSKRGGHGWIQASGDAWEADAADAVHAHSREMTTAGLGLGLALDAPFRPPPMTDPYAPSSSLPDASYSSDSISDTHYTAMPSTLSESTLAQSPDSVHFAADTRTPARSATGGSTVSGGRSQNRRFSIESVASIQTFEGGTKFLKGL